MCAALWHDIGNLYGREGHSDKIHKYFLKAKGFLHDENSAHWIENIGRAHSGKNAIDRHIERETFNMEVFSYHPKFLASLLRIADELDEDRRRISEKIINLPEESQQVYWFFCNCNDSIKVEKDSDDERKSKIVIEGKMNKSELFRKYMKGNLEVTEINEYIYRIDKIRNELMDCNKYLKPYRFRAPDQLELRLRIVEGDRTVMPIDEIFDSVFGYDAFFRKYNNVLEALN